MNFRNSLFMPPNHFFLIFARLGMAWIFLFCSCTGQDLKPTPAQPTQPTTNASSSDLSDEGHWRIGTMASPLILESSGIIASAYLDDVFWTINDSGHDPLVFCVRASGELLATAKFVTGTNRDWESLARFRVDDQHFLVVADVGDNIARHKQGRLYIFPEPKFQPTEQPQTLEITPSQLEFNYEDGARDCEAVAIDPNTNDIWLFEKMMQLSLQRRPQIYRIEAKDWLPTVLPPGQTNPASAGAGKNDLPADQQAAKPLIAKRVAEISHPFITGGDFSADGSELILRTYTYGIHFRKPADRAWIDHFKQIKPTLFPLPIQVQGEAISFATEKSSGAKTCWVSSEGKHQPIWQIELEKSLKQSEKENQR